MQLVVLHPHLLYPGGASKYMLEVVSRLSKKGVPVTIVLTKYDRSLVGRYRYLKFIEIPGPSTGDIYFWLTFPLFIIKLKRVLDKIPNKVLFPQIFPPVWWATIYKLFRPETKIIWMCQEPSAFIHSPLVVNSLPQPGRMMAKILKPLFKKLDIFLVSKVDYIIGNSLYGVKLVKEIYQRDADLYAYPSVDPKRYKPTGRKKNYIFTISRLDKQKNIDLLIKAFTLLPSAIIKKYELLIGGTGTEENNLKSLAESLKMKNKIKFLGQVGEEELPRLYAEAKIAVFLGENEPFGIIPVEAMSCGTPVIAIKAGGVVESVLDGQTGILLTEKLASNLSNKMAALLSNQRLLAMMSKKSRENVVKKFSWDKTANTIYKFLNQENLNV